MTTTKTDDWRERWRKRQKPELLYIAKMEAQNSAGSLSAGRFSLGPFGAGRFSLSPFGARTFSAAFYSAIERKGNDCCLGDEETIPALATVALTTIITIMIMRDT